MVWQIVNKVDTEIAKEVTIWARSPFIEVEGLRSKLKQGFSVDWMIDSVEFTAKLPSPRVIKSHLPFEFLPPKLLDTVAFDLFTSHLPKQTR